MLAKRFGFRGVEMRPWWIEGLVWAGAEGKKGFLTRAVIVPSSFAGIHFKESTVITRKKMKAFKSLAILLLAVALPALPAVAGKIPLASCPPAVRETIRENSQGGKIDKIKRIRIEGRTLYVAEVDLPNDRELKIYIAGDGGLIKTRQEIALADAPAPVRDAARKLAAAGGRLDDVDREVADGKTSYRIEIDRRHRPDLKIVVAEDGAILSQKEDHDH